MHVTLPIPDDLAARLGQAGDVSRRALEAFGLAEYQAGRLTHPELLRLLELRTHAELVAFLASHGVVQDSSSAVDLVDRFRAFSADKLLDGLDPSELIREGRR